MNIVIDANIFISALIKDGTTRRILTKFDYHFLFPEFELIEIIKHKSEMLQKAGYSEKEFYILLLRLLKYVKIIPNDLTGGSAEEACKIMGNIDVDDSIFLATALTFSCPIWSDDKHFKKQDKVKIFTTKDMLNLTST